MNSGRPTAEQSNTGSSTGGNNDGGNNIDIEAIISNAIARFLRENPLPVGPPGPPGAPGEPGPPGESHGSHPLRFNPGDIGFFDPFYDNKSADTGPGMEHTGKDTYFRDVLVFIDRIKDVSRTKGAELVRSNLQLCLRGEALEWYTSQLTDAEKRLLTYGQDLDEWTSFLMERFGPPKNIGMAQLLKEKYTISDAVRHREPREYAMAIIRAVRVAKLDTVHNQLDIIWNGLDVEFQSDIDPPDINATLNQFLGSMDRRKHQWWQKASRMRLSNTAPVRPIQTQNQNRGNTTGQYNNQRGLSRSYGYGNQGSGYQNPGNQNYIPQQQPFQPFYRQNNAYNPQYQQRYQGNQSYGNQGRQAYQNYQSPQQQPQLPTPPQPRQITAAPTLGQQNGSGSRQHSNVPYRNNTPSPFRQDGNRPQPQRAYHTAVSNNIDEHDWYTEEQDCYHNEPKESDTDYPTVHTNSFHSEAAYESEVANHEDVDINFVTAPSKIHHVCKRCGEAFRTRNTLFAHLRETCWKATLAANPVTVSTQAADLNPITGPSPTSRIIESTALLSREYPTGYTFRSSEYTTTDVRFTPNQDSPKLSVCLDSGCPITLGDRQFLRQHIPDFESKLQHMPSHIPVRGFGNKVSTAAEFLSLDLYVDGVDTQGPAVAKLPIEVHITDNLKANMLIGTGTLQAHGFLLDLGAQKATIKQCNELRVPICSIAKSHSGLRRVIKTHHTCTVAPNSIMDVPIVYHGTIPEDRDFLFEPQSSHRLGYEGGVYAHVVDSSMSFVKVKNATSRPVKLSRHTRLGTIVEYNGHGCYLVSPEAESLATCGWQNTNQSESGSLSVSTTLSPMRTDPTKEHPLPNGVTLYGDGDTVTALADLVACFEDVFTDQGKTVDIPETQWMPIHLKPGALPKASKVYPLGQKDRDVVDETFDKLHRQGKLRFTEQPTQFSWPCFVVWRETPQGKKGRVVIDIRGLNAVTEDDSYPLPLQADIISLIAGYEFISTVDAVGYFHQFRVKPEDRHKLTIVSHRGQEESTVALMGYKGSPPYVQRQTDLMLRPLRAFARAFVDDIVVFSHTISEHLQHLFQLFQLLRSKGISLAPTKSYLGYPSVMLLGQRVDSLGMSTAEEKVKAITALRFPENLRDLEIFLGLTGWLRSSIPRYAQRAQPLQDRKTRLTQDMLAKTKAISARPQLSGPARKRISNRLQYHPTEEELSAFTDLQNAFRSPTFLVHYDRNRQLYIDLDASKVWGFAAMIYHRTNKSDSNRTAVQPIMFLSRNINSAERNYWPTELEVAGIVWVVKKVRHMIDSTERAPAIIYTDHSAAIPISRQTSLSTSSTDKLNLRLVRASQYLSSFNLSIRHKSGASNVVPDALSRLQAQTDLPATEKTDILDCLYGFTVSLSAPEQNALLPEVFIYHSTLVEMSDDFKQRLSEAYTKDEQWKKALHTLRNDNDLPEGFRFRLKDSLIYLIGQEGHERLCIPESLYQEVFKLAHDNNFHGGYHRTYDRIAPSIFIKNLSKHLRTYILHCPSCQLNQTRRHPVYGELHPIATPAIPFHTVAIDFIIALPECKGFNSLMTVTCKSTKRNLLIPGCDIWTAEDWANTFITNLVGHDWGIPSAIISDRDSKFMSSFWREIFQKMKVDLLTSTAWHPQTDGQSERTNQTIEIALRFFLTTGEDDWVAVLPYLQGSLNNAVRTTGFAPNDLVYGFRVREGLDLITKSDVDVADLDRLRAIKRQEASDAMAFANIAVKSRYDHMHKALRLAKGSLVFLRLHHGYKVPGVHHKYSNQRVGPFKILEKVGNLAYRLELPPNMHIHPVISIAQLEPATNPADDPYRRIAPPPGPVEEIDTVAPSYEIERFLDKEKDRYLVKWKGYGNEYNAWYPLRALGDAQEYVDEFDSRRPTRRRRPAPTPAPGPRPRGRPRKHH